MVEGVDSVLIFEQIFFVLVFVFKLEIFAACHNRAVIVVHELIFFRGSTRADRDWEILSEPLIGW